MFQSMLAFASIRLGLVETLNKKFCLSTKYEQLRYNGTYIV